MMHILSLPPRRWRPLALAVLLGCALLPMSARQALAHPLGNFTINLYSRLDVGDKHVNIVYIADMAEIPTFQEFGDAALSDQERSEYLHRQAPLLRDGLRLLVDNQPRELRITSQSLSFQPGQGGLPTARIRLDLTAELPALDGERTLAYEDRNFADRLGWHEVIARAGSGVHLLSSDVTPHDLSDELQAYPEDMLASPLDVRSAQLRIAAGPGTTVAPPALARPVDGRTSDRFAALIAPERTGLELQLAALLLAIGLGAVHALSPGHGKAIVGAYLVGSRGTARHALFLGITVTITHTLGVFALGVITLYASRYVLPEQLYPWLGIVSGGLVVATGLLLLRQRLPLARAALSNGKAHGHDHHHDHHGHAHDHADHEHHHHAHDHDAHHHEHFNHGHGSATHTHLPPGADGAAVTWRSLLALGVSGGLIPCPSALIVMLAAISLGRVGFGLLLITAFSLGLAGVLTAIGLLFVYGGRWLARVRAGRQPTRILALVPLASSFIVTLAGVAITARALAEAGLIG